MSVVDWKVKNVQSEVKSKIVRQARNNGFSVAEYLEVIFNEISNDRQQGRWYVNNVSRKQAKKLVQAAKQRNMPLGKFLEFLAERDEDEAEAQARLNKIRGIING